MDASDVRMMMTGASLINNLSKSNSTQGRVLGGPQLQLQQQQPQQYSYHTPHTTQPMAPMMHLQQGAYGQQVPPGQFVFCV